MKSLLLLTLVALLGGLHATAGTLTPSQFRKFQGRYTGSAAGVAGNTGGSGQVGPFATAITVSNKSSEMLAPLLSGLYVAPTHKIVWRKPTGTARRAVLIGVYVGTFTNGFGTQYTARGTRKLVLIDRGSGMTKRYAATLTDDLKEVFTVSGGTAAAAQLAGTLLK
jgi:pectate lyase